VALGVEPPKLDFTLHSKQGFAFMSKATEILYGGAAGGGKSYLMRIAAIIWCCAVPGLQVYIFRRKLPDLVKNHVEGRKGFRALLSVLVESGHVTIVEGEIRFWNDSRIYLCHCKDDKDRHNYQGAEIDVLLIDELTHFSDVVYRFLRARCRSTGIENCPPEYKEAFPKILCGSNPGGTGHLWVKATFIDGHVPLDIWQTDDDEGGMTRQYIPARLEDNPSMEEDDPNYRTKIKGLGSEALVMAWLDGNWDIVEGAYFDCWNSKMVLRPFVIPKHWQRVRSMDWGSARPFSIGWWAVAGETHQTEHGNIIPKGAIVRYREWYGMKDKKPNVGLKLDVPVVAKSALAMQFPGEESLIRDSVSDPSMFIHDGGPSIAETFVINKMGMRKGDNSRIPGWLQMRWRMKGEDGLPMVYCFNTCVHSIRTIPALQHDERKPEDLDTDAEDHAADDWRMMHMSRPYTPPEIEGLEHKPDGYERAMNAADLGDDRSWRTV
jgi:hypothetical protein